MKYLYAVLLCTGFSFSVHAQDTIITVLKDYSTRISIKDPGDTVKGVWKVGGVFTLNLSQGSLSNWQGGGDNSSFSAVGFFNIHANLKNGKSSWNNNLDLGYGYLNTTSLGSRKSDDRIDLISRYGYELNKTLSIGALFNFRTQFSRGFDYLVDSTGEQVRNKTSNFLAPAYILLSVGGSYKPAPYLSVFISPLTQRWVLVHDRFLSSIGAYGVEIGQRSRDELGALLSADYQKEISHNIVLKSRMDLFSYYRNKPQNIDVYWTNVLNLKFNKYLSTNINVDLLYDDDAIARWQVRQLLGVGFSAKF